MLATPVLALFVDVKFAVPVLILPNLVMDGLQLLRLGELGATARRMAVVLAFGLAGTVLGTRLLVALPSRAVTLVVGALVLLFVALNSTRLRPRVSPRAGRWLAPVVGLVAGVSGGLANTPGLPLVMYFYALGLPKAEFIRAVAFTFIVYKVLQFGVAAWYGLIDRTLLAVSLALTLAALGGFRLGLGVQDRLDPVAFNRAVLAVLAVLGAGLIARAAL